MEVAQVGLEARIEAERLVHGQALADDGQDGAILRSDLGDVVGCADAAAPRHVDMHDLRAAGDMLDHVAAEQPRIGIVTAADTGTDDEADLLARVEFRHRIGKGRCADLQGRQSRCEDGDGRAHQDRSPHRVLRRRARG